MNIYVGNFSNDLTEEDLRQAFAAFGEVASATIIKDKFSGLSRGFGFVEMPAQTQAETAIQSIKEIKGRMVTVNEARPRTPNYRGAGAGSGSGGGGKRRTNTRESGPRRGGWY